MFSKNKHKSESGSFKVSKFSKLYREPNAKSLIVVFGAVFIVVGVIGLGWYLLSQDKNKDSSKFAFVQTAEASTVPGWWLQQYFGSSVCNEDKCQLDADPDEDKLNNGQEYFYHTNPLDSHTVKDQLNDGQLVARGFDPSRPNRKTFEEVISDDNILGESIVVGQDIKKMVAESQDISKINLDLPPDDNLRIIYNDSQETYQTYAIAVQSAIDKYFRPDGLAIIQEVLQSGNGKEIDNIRLSAVRLSEELKTIPVPAKVLMFHKYTILVYELLDDILPPNGGQIELSGQQGDLWYDNVQSFMAATQRLNLEKQRLIYQVQPRP